MFMRLVQVKLRPETSAEISQLYNEKIIAVLRQTPGCLCASLIRSINRPDEAISLTLWDSPQHADAYEQSGLFQKLLHEAEPYFSNASEWKIQLSKDLTLEYAPVRQEPLIKSHRVTVAADEPPSLECPGRMHVRIVAVRLKAGMVEEFARLYASDILPVLQTVAGCQYAFLTEGVGNEVLSISIWSSKEHADAYETGGLFDRLTKKAQHTYAELYQWKMAFERKASRTVATSDDLTVQRYTVVTGESFR